MKKIRLKSIEVYHPDNRVNNQFYINHFNRLGVDIRGLLESFGRKNRYIANGKETTLTMGIRAAQKVLQTAGLRGEDIDLILFSSQFPEFTFPSQSLIVHHEIHGKPSAQCMDINVNCVGMLVAFENAVKVLQATPGMERALIIGSDYASVHCKKDDPMTYPNFGDAAAAVIIEKTERDAGFIDSAYQCDGSTWELVKYPACGMSQIGNEEIPAESKKLNWTPFNGLFIVEHAVKSIRLLLARNRMDVADIDTYCFSQYAEKFRTLSAESLDVPIDKFIYVGDEYGYTGTSSPFIALYEGIRAGKIKENDTVCLWSVGVNWIICTVLLKI